MNINGLLGSVKESGQPVQIKTTSAGSVYGSVVEVLFGEAVVIAVDGERIVVMYSAIETIKLC